MSITLGSLAVLLLFGIGAVLHNIRERIKSRSKY